MDVNLWECKVGDEVLFTGGGAEDPRHYTITAIKDGLYWFVDEQGGKYPSIKMENLPVKLLNPPPPEPPPVTDRQVSSAITRLKELCQTSHVH